MEERLKNLAVRLLDNEEGISEEAYVALLSLLTEETATILNTHVKANDGKFYLSENALQEWKTN